MEEQVQPAKNELSNLGIKELFYKYVRFLPLFVISVALSLFVAFVYLRYATLVYRSTGTMIVQDEKGSGGSDDKLEKALNSDNNKNIQNEIEYLQSKQMMMRVVKSRNLNFTYMAKGNIKELNVYKSCPFEVEAVELADSSSGFVVKLDFSNNTTFRVNGESTPFTFGQFFKNSNGVFRLTRTSEGEVGKEYKLIWQPTSVVASGLASGLVIVPKQNTGILNITLESTNAQLAADVINTLMREYQKATIEDKNATTQQRLAFIDRELDTVTEQLNDITKREMTFLKRNNLFSPESQTNAYLDQVRNANDEKLVQQNLLTKAYQIEGDLLTRKSSIPVPSSLGLEDPTLNKLVDAYNQAQIENKALRESAPVGNKAVRQKQEVIDQLQKNILNNLVNIKRSYSAVI
ncbi:MAG: GumC family protein, partial [Flavisolibacter sp.]